MKNKKKFLSLFMLLIIFILSACGNKHKTIDTPAADTKDYTYTGSEITYQIAESDYYTISGNKQTNAGTYEVTLSLKDQKNYSWSSTNNAVDLKYRFVISPMKVQKPTVSSTVFSYTGNEITLEIPTSNHYKITGNKNTEVGDYTAIVSLNDKTNYIWSDNTTSDITFNYSIKDTDLSKATISSINDVTYTGEALTPTPEVTFNGKTLKLNTDYQISYQNNVNVGEATLTINGIGEYKNSKSINFNVVKATPNVFAPIAKELTYNGEALELITAGSTSFGNIQYKLNDGEYSTSIPTATNAGTYTVYYKVDGTDNYNGYAETSIEVTIAKANPTLTAPTEKKNLVYSGEALELINAGSTTAGTIEYKLNDGEYSSSIPTATLPGTYMVYYKVTGNDNYNDIAEDFIEVTINKLDPTVTKPTPKDNLVYNGSEQELINAGSAIGGTINYKLENGEYSTSIPTAKNAGTYKIYYKVVADENYNDLAEEYLEVTIAKSDLSFDTLPEAKENLVYDATAQELINVGTASAGTIEYKLNNGEYTTSIPQATNAGTYTIYYHIKGDNNYNDLEESSIEVVIAKANPVLTDPTPITGLIANGEPQTLINAGSTTAGTLVYSLDNINYSESLPKGTEGTTYTVYYKVIGNDNYNDIATKHFEVVIIVKTKITPDVTAPTAKENLAYTGDAQELIIAGSTTGGTLQYKLDNGSYQTEAPTATNAGKYTVYYRVVGNDDYNDVAEKSIEVTIAKIDSAITKAPTVINNLVYTGNELTLINTGAATGGTLQYKLEGGQYSDSLPKATNAGNYTIYYKVLGDINHNDTTEETIPVSIAKADITSYKAPTAKENLVYNGNTLVLINAGTVSGGTLLYSLDNNDYLGTVPFGTNAGDYIVYYKVTGDNNHNDKAYATINVTIEKAFPNVKTEPHAKTLHYTGSSQELIIAGEVEGGTFLYSLNNEDNYSEDIPTATEKDTYTIYYKVQGDANHTNIESSTIAVVITDKEIPVITSPTSIENLIYSGEAQVLINAGSTNGGTLVYSLDNVNYSAELPSAINANNYTVYYKVIGDETYSDSSINSISTSIAKKSIIGAVVTLDKSEYVYTGAAIAPTITSIIIDTLTLSASDYTVTYNTSAIDIGNYTLSITAKNNFQSTIIVGYTIVSQNIDIANTTITLNSNEFTFNNANQLPTVTVTDQDETLVLNKDYTISYTNSVAGVGNTKDAGIITITITGCGNKYALGSTNTTTYTINKLIVTNPTITILTVTYTGNSITPSLISVINNEINITDQASIGSGNAKTNAGSYDIAIQFNSNNIETNSAITGTFTINPKSYNTLTYNPIADVFYTTGTPTKGATPSVLIQDGGATLVEGTDYDLSYSNNKAIGKATVEVTFKGNYIGSQVLHFNIVTASYTITYMDGETELSTQSYHSSDETVTLSSASKDYYTGQWRIKGTYTFLDFNDSIAPSVLGGDVTLETVWTPEEFTITYEPNGGSNSPSNPAKYTVESPTITLDAPLERTGATFVGWYTESTFTNLITEIVTGSHGNIDLFAKWSYTEYDIIYNLNDGTNSPSNPAKYTIITNTITLANPTKDYYDFAGWFSDENCTAGNEVTQIAKGSYGAVEIFAKWTLHEYEITYNYNINSSVVTNTNALKYILGNGFNLVNAAAYTYEFAGWYTDLEMQIPITALSSTNPEDITIYGKFNSSNTSIEKYYNGIFTTANACGTITNNMSTKLVGEEVTVTATVASGYNFLGWYLNDSDTPFETGLEFTFTLTTNTVVYKAKYSGNKLNYSSDDTNRGTVTGSVTNNTNVSVGTEVTLTATTKSGYTFIGWFKNNASTAESTSLSLVYTMEDADINFIAKWIRVTVLSNNTTRGNVSSLTSTYVLTDTPTITATANTGYYFLGWYIGENEVSTNASYNITMPTIDTTYTAHFINNNITVKNYIVGYTYEESIYTVTYTENNNIDSTPTITNVGSTLTYTMPDNNTFIFAGWYDRADNNKVRLTTTISSDVEIALTETSQVIYALWVSPINISKDPNSDDTLEFTRTFGLITDGIIYEALDNEDYLWDGWYDNTNPNYTIVDQSQVTTPKSGITYYTLENSIYTECENLTAWADATDYYVISPIESSKTLTLTYDNTYKSLIETPQTFNGLNQYTAKWILSGITVTADTNKGTVDKHKESNGTYTIYAEPLDGYRFVEWTHDNVNYSSTATTSNVPDASGVYIAVFETRDDIPYKVNIYLENLDGTETLVETISYADGTTSGYKDIDISTVQELDTYSLTNYNLGYVCQNNDSSPLDPESGTTYRLSILNNEQGHLDCHYNLKTVSVTYHYNNGTTFDVVDEKYDIANSRYNLKAIDNVTWYTDKALTPENIVTYVDADDEVWACYNGNNNLTTNFGLNNNSLIENEYYYLAYTGTITTDTDIVFPDYVDDKPVKKVNVDNLYKETKPYKSLTLPSELELIEYGTYNSKAISWIILSTTDNTGSKTYKLLSEKIIDSSTYRNIATVLNNIILTNYVTLTFENNLLSRTEVISSFYSTITLDINMVPATWWTNTRFINSNTGLETGTYYVKSVISDADTFTAVSNDKKNEAIGIRPTITLTL